jgi:hypothetical protein
MTAEMGGAHHIVAELVDKPEVVLGEAAECANLDHYQVDMALFVDIRGEAVDLAVDLGVGIEAGMTEDDPRSDLCRCQALGGAHTSTADDGYRGQLVADGCRKGYGFADPDDYTADAVVTAGKPIAVGVSAQQYEKVLVHSEVDIEAGASDFLCTFRYNELQICPKIRLTLRHGSIIPSWGLLSLRYWRRIGRTIVPVLRIIRAGVAHLGRL